ncbi:MAG: copper amine oxidase [Clostridiales bacterium]|nr:copper amine oxidase [Clostridiales bacterium]MCF8023777.1 copper amine oxidase [Clostridiales bacterium]
MKKLLLTAAILTTLFSTCLTPAYTQEEKPPVQVITNNTQVNYTKVKPVMKNGITMVPIRTTASALNIKISWRSCSNKIIAKKGNTIVKLQTNNKTAYRQNNTFLLTEAPVIIQNKTLIPLRFFSEAFNFNVKWIASKNTVLISPPYDLQTTAFYALGNENFSSWTDLFGKRYPSTGKKNTGIIDTLALGWYSLDKKGNLVTQSRTGWQRPQGWEQVLDAAEKYGLKTQMVIHMTDKDDKLFNFLINESAVNKAIEQIIEEAKLYDGINLDFEGLGYNVNDAQLNKIQTTLNKFVKKLDKELHEKNKKFVLCLHPLNSTYKGYDYKELGEHADRVIIMAYEYGPIPEPLHLVTQAVELSKKHITPGKLVLGISAATETPGSIKNKIQAARDYRLEGIALWRLGIISDEIWHVLKTTK